MRAADPVRPRSYGVAAIATVLALQLGIAVGAVETRLARGGAAPAAPSPAAVTSPRLPVAAATPRLPAAAAAPRQPAPSVSAPSGSAPVRVTAAGLWSGTRVAEPLAVRADGTLAVPRTAGAVGWWAAGPRPGEAGAAVLVGHVDLDGRLGVFARLSRARPGTLVTVDAGAGPVTFRVTEVRQYPKVAFPTDEVYAPTDAHELRLVTCGGRFDRRTGHYTDNVVVSAVRA